MVLENCISQINPTFMELSPMDLYMAKEDISTPEEPTMKVKSKIMLPQVSES